MLKGKMIIQKPPTIGKIAKLYLSLPISTNHNFIQLYIYFFYVNGIFLIHTILVKNQFPLYATLCIMVNYNNQERIRNSKYII